MQTNYTQKTCLKIKNYTLYFNNIQVILKKSRFFIKGFLSQTDNLYKNNQIRSIHKEHS